MNIIAHSKGGLEARYLISTMGMADKVASLTTISTPHNGSVTVDRLMDIVPQPLVKLGCGVTDLWFRILGDKSPDTYSAVNSFKTNSADIFNIKNPDSPDVYYQSCAFAMKKPTSDIFMSWTWLAVNGSRTKMTACLRREPQNGLILWARSTAVTAEEYPTAMRWICAGLLFQRKRTAQRRTLTTLPSFTRILYVDL